MAKEKILIIEDEPDIVRMLEYNLKKEGFRTVCASGGGEALRRAERERPDIILLDLMLPEILFIGRRIFMIRKRMWWNCADVSVWYFKSPTRSQN